MASFDGSGISERVIDEFLLVPEHESMELFDEEKFIN